jgi:transcriptional regulator with XRE-family HTH domain
MGQEPPQPEEKQEATLGQRIRARRIALDWSQDTLAEKIGVSSLSILRWESDRSFPRGDDIQLSLIKVLGLPKDEFTGRKKRPSAKKEERPSPAKEVKKNEGLLPVKEEKEEEGLLPIKVILPYHYWQIPLPSNEEGAEKEIVEYKVPPLIVYKGFYVQVPYEKYGGYLQERRVTSNGKPLLPYDTWVKPETVVYGWGFTGAGPRHLAQSILLDYFEIMYPNEHENVLRSWVDKYYFNFKMDFTAWFDEREWEIWSGAITAWLKEQREQGDPAPEHTLDDVKYGWTGWWKRWDKYKGT